MSSFIDFLPSRMTDYASSTPQSAGATTGAEPHTIFGYVQDSFSSPTLLGSSSLPGLDPILKDFWSGFPCPPPWNTGLLLKVNWTSCVGQAVGQRLMMFMADRCNIHLDTSTLGPPAVGRDPTKGRDGLGEEATEGGVRKTCDTACHVLLVLLSVLVVVGAVAVTCFILHRQRSKRKDQRANGQPHAGGGVGAGEGRTYYAGIHYASASVVNRENERPLPPCPEGAARSWGMPPVALPRQLQAYVYNPSDSDSAPSERRFHLHLCPMNSRVAYRVMHPCCPPGQADSDTSHVYDYISDTESVRWRGLNTRGRGLSTDYCTCDDGIVAVACVGGIGGGLTPGLSEGYHSDHDHITLRADESGQPQQRTLKGEVREVDDLSGASRRKKDQEEEEDTTTDASSNEVDRRHALLPRSLHACGTSSNPKRGPRNSFSGGLVDGSECEDTDDDFPHDNESDLSRGRSNRANALALHPGYFLDYFDKDTSTV